MRPLTPEPAEQATDLPTSAGAQRAAPGIGPDVHLSAQEGIPLRLACRCLQSMAPGSLKAALAADCLRHRLYARYYGWKRRGLSIPGMHGIGERQQVGQAAVHVLQEAQGFFHRRERAKTRLVDLGDGADQKAGDRVKMPDDD